MISLHDSVQKIYSTKWSLTTNFAVFLEPTDKSLKLWKTECGLPADDISLYIKDFILPQVGSGTPIEEFVNNRYRLALGTFDPVTISLTFKDHDSLKLYRSFTKFLYKSKLLYPEDYLIGIRVIKLRDREGDQDAFEVMRFDKPNSVVFNGVDPVTMEINIPELIPAPQAPQNPQAPPGTLEPLFFISVSAAFRSMFPPAFLYAVRSADPTMI